MRVFRVFFCNVSWILVNKMLKKVPLVVILGSTGTGKTKLSLELAKKYGGEIISADSMQVYKGLNIATAKATTAEQQVAPHHLLDVAQPGIPYTVVDFRNSAHPIINDLLGRNKMPIVVGGTNYYIESLLWNVLMAPTSSSASTNQECGVKRKLDNSDSESDDMFHIDTIKRFTTQQMNEMESCDLHKCLQQIDPITANRLHPNNKRKIIRAIEIFNSSGKSMSSLLEEQRSQDGGSNLGGPLRYKNVILFWLQCEQEILNRRLDSRVDSMLENGLLAEIRNFHENFVKPFTDKDYTKGILQTIGFKEFVPYLEKFSRDEDDKILQYTNLKDDKMDIPQGLEILTKCLEELKLVTRRYSKKQSKWVRNRFLGNLSRDVPPLYKLDTTDPSKWQEDVYGRAEDVIEAFIGDRMPKIEPEKRFPGPKEGLNDEVTNFCEVCQRTFVGEFQWKIHLESKKHKRIQIKKAKSDK
ncbi:tRNA dimethylallyltransferase [Phlebotomus papatasi]|uniref:tRNA dimethylallyltransferase n=1 Tax=Phlebotomus papatasi TaxID=29031 RepID=UPI002483AF00|nr:tRNA dimethylallyltransferase [Phlebotomus papatasi]XP_055712711.1 tRNA dimethylallyltransferase [Phlebotomus papatasi]